MSFKYSVFIGIVVFLNISTIFDNSYLSRRVKITPYEHLINEGFYIPPIAEENIKKLDIRLVSFDWSVLNRNKDHQKTEGLLRLLKAQGIKMIIVTEAQDREGILSLLKEWGWADFFNNEDVYITSASGIYRINKGDTITKSQILEKIANENGYLRNQVVHFDDSERHIISIQYRGFLVIGVLGNVGKEDMENFIVETQAPVVRDLGIVRDNIFRILNIKI